MYISHKTQYFLEVNVYKWTIWAVRAWILRFISQPIPFGDVRYPYPLRMASSGYFPVVAYYVWIIQESIKQIGMRPLSEILDILEISVTYSTISLKYWLRGSLPDPNASSGGSWLFKHLRIQREIQLSQK